MNAHSIQLSRVPLKNIVVEDDLEVNFIEALALADLYSLDSDQINYFPLTVSKNLESIDGHFKLINGIEIYQALLQSDKQWAWALIVDPLIHTNWKLELGLVKPKINICNLDDKDFISVFEHLQSTNKKLSTINVDKLVAEYADDPFRSYWSDLNILMELKCGITKAKLRILNDFLTCSPDLSTLKPINPICINYASEDEVFTQIQRLKIEPEATKLRKLDSIVIARSIVSFNDRNYFASPKDLIKARLGVTSAVWPSLEAGFLFSPFPTPIPNKSRFLLSQLSVAQLRKEATMRALEFTDLKKADLITLLSSE